MLRALPDGYGSEPLVIFRTRGDGTATPVMPVDSTNWTLCDLHNDAALRRSNGLIDVSGADFVTLWVLPIFASTGATALQLQVRSLIPLKNFGSGASASDVASVAASAVLTSAGSAAALCKEAFIGLFAALKNGTNLIEGVYQITDASEGVSLTVDAAVDDAVGNASSIECDILAESQECVIETPSGAGVSNIYPNTFNIAAAAVTDARLYHFTVPVAAAQAIRVYAKSVGADMSAMVAISRGLNY